METPATGPRKRLPRATAAVERQLLDEVLALKDQVNHLAVAIERQTNAIAQTQMLAMREIEAQGNLLNAIEIWKNGVETERAEERGAARSRKSMMAAVAGLASLGGGLAGALFNWVLKLV